MKQFHDNKYVVIKDILSQDVVNIASQYALLDEIHNFHPEGANEQVSGAHSKYGDLLMDSILVHLKPAIEWASGLTLIPTYSYWRVYRPGHDLKPHTDRPSCEISTTVSFKQNYMSANGSYAWPMFVGEGEGTPYSLEPGDAIVYKGCELKHWREKFDAPEFSYHIQGFFHYVDANGPYAEFALDKREVLGAPPALVQKSKETIADAKTKSYITYVS